MDSPFALQSISLKNYRSYGENPQTINFQAPLTIICGKNGSGKSSIIEALKYLISAKIEKRKDKKERYHQVNRQAEKATTKVVLKIFKNQEENKNQNQNQNNENSSQIETENEKKESNTKNTSKKRKSLENKNNSKDADILRLKLEWFSQENRQFTFKKNNDTKWNKSSKILKENIEKDLGISSSVLHSIMFVPQVFNTWFFITEFSSMWTNFQLVPQVNQYRILENNIKNKRNEPWRTIEMEQNSAQRKLEKLLEKQSTKKQKEMEKEFFEKEFDRIDKLLIRLKPFDDLQKKIQSIKSDKKLVEDQKNKLEKQIPYRITNPEPNLEYSIEEMKKEKQILEENIQKEHSNFFQEINRISGKKNDYDREIRTVNQKLQRINRRNQNDFTNQQIQIFSTSSYLANNTQILKETKQEAQKKISFLQQEKIKIDQESFQLFQKQQIINKEMEQFRSNASQKKHLEAEKDEIQNYFQQNQHQSAIISTLLQVLGFIDILDFGKFDLQVLWKAFFQNNQDEDIQLLDPNQINQYLGFLLSMIEDFDPIFDIEVQQFQEILGKYQQKETNQTKTVFLNEILHESQEKCVICTRNFMNEKEQNDLVNEITRRIQHLQISHSLTKDRVKSIEMYLSNIQKFQSKLFNINFQFKDHLRVIFIQLSQEQKEDRKTLFEKNFRYLEEMKSKFNEIQQNENRLNSIESQLISLNEILKNSKFEEKQKNLDEIMQKIQQTENYKSENNQELEKIKAQFNEIVFCSRQSKLNTLNQQMEEFTKLKSLLDQEEKNKRQEYEAKNNQLLFEKKQKEDILDSLYYQKNYHTTIKSINEIEQTIQTFQNDIDNLEKQTLEYEDIKNEDYEENKEKYYQLQNKFSLVSQELEIYKNVEQKIEKKMKIIENAEKLKKSLTIFTETLEQSIQTYQSTFFHNINAKLKKLWRKTYHPTGITHLKIEPLDSQNIKSTKQPLFEVVAYAQNTEIHFKKESSQGQQMLASLLIRIAIAESLCPFFPVLSLDEPTANLDFEIKSNFAKSLSKIIRYQFKSQKIPKFQYLLITHDSEFVQDLIRNLDDCPFKLFLISNEKEGSQIQEVENTIDFDHVQTLLNRFVPISNESLNELSQKTKKPRNSKLKSNIKSNIKSKLKSNIKSNTKSNTKSKKQNKKKK
ncbi:rad50 [Anaeramoeba ignava]|uniref:Rad50 n=1 Tax=Anaeramoeba ignava TaxID=1746090 RepID=A0A9Q0L5M3_ANAIG|nr:rad50 [Anaeramoeba ignava]